MSKVKYVLGAGLVVLYVICMQMTTLASLTSTDSLYSDTLSYREYIVGRSNCYAYAMQLYNDENQLNEYSHNLLPGEFDKEGLSWEALIGLYGKRGSSATNVQAYIDLVKEELTKDFKFLEVEVGLGEGSFKEALGNTEVPEGYRRILMVLRHPNDPNLINKYGKTIASTVTADFHFYIRHSDGVWSHKKGNTLSTDLAVTAYSYNYTEKTWETHPSIYGEQLTDANIDTLCELNGYTAYKQYYDIPMPATMDFPYSEGHGDGDRSNAELKPYWDGAGDQREKAIAGKLVGWDKPKVEGKINYPWDIDYYAYTAVYSGPHLFMVEKDYPLVSKRMTLKLYNSDGINIYGLSTLAPVQMLAYITAKQNYHLQIQGETEDVYRYTIKDGYSRY